MHVRVNFLQLSTLALVSTNEHLCLFRNPQHYNKSFLRQAMQDDYARFMNYSDGRYHADYLLYKRSHGQNIAGMAPSKVVKYADITDEM